MTALAVQTLLGVIQKILTTPVEGLDILRAVRTEGDVGE